MPTKVRNGNHAAAAAADETTELLRGLEQANANTKAVVQVVNNVGSATNTTEAAKAALDTVKDAFGWAYGSYWVRDPKENALRFCGRIRLGERRLSPRHHGSSFPRR